ncbi:hypothetical protein CPB83DRAFT_855442 [Crepidotus variabilis]|uniref:Uncharacterized protein n=1 Tax=Crepidotus variabilis TaxID=179855 RepID=A0A9P6JP89_9AGAR|nr:hypothetical protein CPB83DRAFT_855442 [Crepidotus variabilis]
MLLPPELIDHIHDELLAVDPKNSDSDAQVTSKQRKALAKCLLISPSFRNRSIRHLFRVVEISGTLSRMQQRTSLLAAILAAESGLNSSSLLPIASVIEEFALSFAHVGRHGLASTLHGGKATESFVLLLRLIRCELDAGTGPKKITLHLHRQLWTSIAPSFTEQIQTLVQSSHLTHLSLSSVLLVPPSLLHDSHIISLSLNDARFQVVGTTSMPLGLATIEPPQLSEFIGSGYIAGLLSPGSQHSIYKKLFSQLTILRWYSAEFEEKRDLKLILQACANSLEELDLGISSTKLNDTDMLRDMKKLRQLNLQVECASSTLENLTNFFTTSSTLLGLYAVHLAFSAGHRTTQNSQLPLGLHGNFANSQHLDRKLSSSFYPALKNITISIALDRRGLWPPPAVEDVRSAAENELRELFPSLTASTTKKFLTIVNLELA